MTNSSSLKENGVKEVKSNKPIENPCDYVVGVDMGVGKDYSCVLEIEIGEDGSIKMPDMGGDTMPNLEGLPSCYTGKYLVGKGKRGDIVVSAEGIGADLVEVYNRVVSGFFEFLDELESVAIMSALSLAHNKSDVARIRLKVMELLSDPSHDDDLPPDKLCDRKWRDWLRLVVKYCDLELTGVLTNAP